MAHVVRIPRWGVIPDGEIVHLKYFTGAGIQSVAGAYATHKFRLNSIFDPDITLVGHQPLGHDQLAALYFKYIVYKCTWRVTATNLAFATTNVDHNANVIQIVYNGTSSGLNVVEAIENNRSLLKTIPPMGDDENVQHWTGQCTLARLAGVEKDEYYSDIDNYAANFGSNPVEDMTLEFGVYNDGAQTVIVKFDILLEYHCKVFEPKLLTGS